MIDAVVDDVVEAVLYEGYILYPYRPSVKNHQRWTFGGLYPPAFTESHPGADASAMQTECLLEGSGETELNVTVRFLHLTARTVGELPAAVTEWPSDAELPWRTVPSMEVAGKLYQSWQEAAERKIEITAINLADLLPHPRTQPFKFSPARQLEPIHNESGQVVALLCREQQEVEGSVELTAAELAGGVYKISVRVENRTPLQSPLSDNRDEALLRALVSTHTILRASAGSFVSATDPPESLRDFAAQCRNVGAWPVLVGVEPDRTTMLASPIILYDYPRIAPQSPGSLFDSLEIDEILTLRVMTLTDEEKRAMLAVDPRAGDLLRRTEALGRREMASLHGLVKRSGS